LMDLVPYVSASLVCRSCGAEIDETWLSCILPPPRQLPAHGVERPLPDRRVARPPVARRRCLHSRRSCGFAASLLLCC
jgi:hypothetical protein